MTERIGYKFIGASKVVEKLERTDRSVQPNLEQARILASVDEDEQEEVWEEAFLVDKPTSRIAL